MTIPLNRTSGYPRYATALTVGTILLALSSSLWANDPASMALPDDDTGRCRYGAEHMIDIARQSLLEPSSRVERVERRRQLTESWESRLSQGEDPCEVYVDIQKAATTF
jgi:hypothetical protein